MVGSVADEIADNFEVPLNAWVKVNNITKQRVMARNDRPFAQMYELVYVKI